MKHRFTILFGSSVASVLALPATAAPKGVQVQAVTPPPFTLTVRSPRFSPPNLLHLPRQLQQHPDWQWQTEIEPRRHPNLMPAISPENVMQGDKKRILALAK